MNEPRDSKSGTRSIPCGSAESANGVSSTATSLHKLAQTLQVDASFPVDIQLNCVHEKEMGPTVLVLNGPNINLLGIREPALYGTESFDALIALAKREAKKAGFNLCRCYQSNHEGDLVDAIQSAYGRFDGIVINPGAYTHSSIALLDALKGVCIPAVEVHISDVSTREDFRQRSYVRQACIDTVMGKGIAGYGTAMHILAAHLGL